MTGFELTARGYILGRHARIVVADLPSQVAEREYDVLKTGTGWDESCFTLERVAGARGPGNIVIVKAQTEHVMEVFTGFGEVGRPAEAVAADALQSYWPWLTAGVPVGVYLADQILLPLAVAGAGRYLTLPLSRHSRTHIELIGKFLDTALAVQESDHDQCMVHIG